jgi:hypothetical protein
MKKPGTVRKPLSGQARFAETICKKRCRPVSLTTLFADFVS